jgi:hypothetical protein
MQLDIYSIDSNCEKSFVTTFKDDFPCDAEQALKITLEDLGYEIERNFTTLYGPAEAVGLYKVGDRYVQVKER